MKTNQNRVLPIQWNKSSFYFLVLVVLVLLGFWPTYFAKFLDGTADFSFYFHFHAAMAAAWVALLVLQPMLIKRKKLALHRKLGKLTYVLLPLFFLSVILLKHHSIGGKVSPNLGASLWLQLKDLVIIGIMKIYLNAAKEGETAYTNAQYFYPDLYLGGHSTFNRWYFNGALDDLRIYNRALSDAEVQVIYNAEKL